MVNDTGTFIVSSVFMDSTPTAYLKWGINKFKITFPTLCYSHQDPGPASDPPATSPYINLNLLQHFLSTLKLPGISPSPGDIPFSRHFQRLYRTHNGRYLLHVPGGNRSLSQAMQAEHRRQSITSAIPAPPHSQTCL